MRLELSLISSLTAEHQWQHQAQQHTQELDHPPQIRDQLQRFWIRCRKHWGNGLGTPPLRFLVGCHWLLFSTLPPQHWFNTLQWLFDIDGIFSHHLAFIWPFRIYNIVSADFEWPIILCVFLILCHNAFPWIMSCFLEFWTLISIHIKFLTAEYESSVLLM